ncbi:MAG TPA: NAD-dependent epimerase/dehydratase family protein [Gaiellaceae bacterium]|nr:NAD-dependent epimerase/dehydratase family protein [Gaiellaceae bacterium]
MIAVAGASGFVGRRLVERLREDGTAVRGLSRRGDVPVDVLDPATLGPVLDGIELAYYLVHAVGDPGAFDETEANGARNFARAAAEQGVARIVYLGGLAHGDDLSDHMRSRQEVGRLLGETGVDVVELRASIVVGDGSLSWELVTTLVDNAPLIALPDWVESRTQPIAIDDVVDYLVAAREAAPGVYEIGGADVLTYRELLAAYADETGRGAITLTLPSPGAPPRAFTDLLPEKVRASLHLVESLRFDSTVRSDASKAFGVRPVGVREAIRRTQRAPR